MNRHQYTAEIAGSVFSIESRFDHRAFFRDYLSEKPPAFTLRPEQADLDAIRAQFEAESAETGEPIPALTDAFLENNALHALLAEEMARRNALLVHGSAIAVDGETYLFTAKSGTGKSTHTRLWREKFGSRAVMVNDDKPFLLIREDGVFACGTPWNGKHRLSSNVCLPLKALIRLQRGAENRIVPISAPEMFQTLLGAAYRSRKKETMANVLAMEDAVLSKTALYALWCNMEPEAADVSYNGMKKPEL